MISVHERIKLFRNLKGSYFSALRRAHKMHHKHIGKEDGESFGFIIVGKKYYDQ
jgi:beta-carotene 3-hydroxylase